MKTPELGRQLRAWRRQAGLTQIEVAEALELQQQTVSDWERGKAIPRRGRVRQVEELLGLQPDQLVRAIQVATEGASAGDGGDAPAALSGKLERLNARDRRLVERMVDERLADE